MTTCTNFHDVKSIKVKQRPLGTSGTWTTDVIATNKDGHDFTFTLFHEGPLSIEGSDFINFVNSAEEA